MIRRILLASCAVTLSAAATAQSYTVGNQGVDWGTLSTNPTGSAPADAYEPADIALPAGVNLSDWLITTGDRLYSDRCAASPGSYYKNTAAGNATCGPLNLGEKKIRFSCEPSVAKQADNILGLGIPVFGHDHLGAGPAWDENSTYTTLRTNPGSTCQGGPLIGSNYMEPALEKVMSNGLKVIMRYDNQAIYYVTGTQDQPNKYTWLRRGMKFVLGANPKDFNDTARRAVYAAAGFLYPGSPVQPAGQNGWYCGRFDGTQVPVTDTTAQMQSDDGTHQTYKSRYLRTPAGGDPFGGQCYGTAAQPAELVSDYTAPGCWDRTNLQATDGRGHFWYAARHADNSFKDSCPTTDAAHGNVSYAHVPEGEFKSSYYVTGFADYGGMFFSSDRMRMSTTECPDATSPCDGVSGGNVPGTVNGVYYSRVSLSPCRSTGLDFCNGETGHADYTYGQDDVFETMERECNGISVRGIAPVDGPAECNSGQVDRYHNLLYGASPNPAYTLGCVVLSQCSIAKPGNVQRYMPITSSQGANVTISHTH